MKRSVPLEYASLVYVLDAGMDGMTPCVSSGVTSGGDECFTTIPLSRPAASAISARERSVSGPFSQWMITGQSTSLASSMPLRSTLLDASHISWLTGKWGLPTSPMAAALPSATSRAAASMPSTMISSARSSP